MRVSKEAVEAVDKIEEEINQIDINKIELDPDSLEYLKTVEAYLHCFDQLEASYESIDPSHKLAEYDLTNPNLPIQQVSKTGEPVKDIEELYEVAELMLPIFDAKINGLLDQLTTSGSPEELSGVYFKLAPLKGKQRAFEKAQDDYSKKDPGPPESWLYDIDRGSVLFNKAELLFQFLELVRADESIVIVKFKNRFRNPTLSGYRDFNMQIQITNDEDGSKHICELQLHIRTIKETAILLKSHAHYEFFRKFYSGATDSLKERMDDLRAICKGGSLDMAFLTNAIENPLEMDHMTRLADLFEDYMSEYQIAIVITNAMKVIMEPHDWYMRMGDLFWRQGKMEEALALCETALDIRLDTLGPEDTKVADTYNRMATILRNQGKFEEAMGMHHKALDIRVQTLGLEHKDVATSYNNMAAVLFNQGKFEEATTMYKKSLDIRVKILGAKHPDVAQSYNNMALVLRNQGKLEDALTLYKKALDIYMKALGAEHTLVADSCQNMAMVLEDQGKLEEAMTLYKKALDIQEKALGPEHTLVAQCYYNMSFVAQNQGKMEEALTFVQKARDIYLKALGPQHPSTKDCDSMIAYLQDRLSEE